MSSKTIACCCLLAVIFGCSPQQQPPPLFELLEGQQTGIDFENSVFSSPDFNILEYLYFYNGGGVSAGDINNDGLVDLYFTSNQGSNKLYLNKGNFSFEDITENAGVGGAGTWSTGTSMADVNGDGLLDIYLSQVGDYKEAQGKNQLFMNQGDLTFTEQAEAYGLDFRGFSTQASFLDYDNDGDLDMYLLNHSVKKPEVFSNASTRNSFDELGGDRFYESKIAQGENRFEDVTKQSGIYSSSIGFGLGIAVDDINEDGWADIYVSNDFTENDYLYINNQDGTFTESLESRIQYTSRFSMGNDIGDINNDGRPDIITTDMLPRDPAIWQKSVGEDKAEVYDIKLGYGYGHQYVRNSLQLNRGNGQFSDIALMTGTYATDWSWAPLIFDMDNDGLKDIHISNGIYKRPNDLDYVNYTLDGSTSQTEDEIEAELIASLPAVKIPNYSGRNLGNYGFEDIAEEWGLNQSSFSNGSTYADLDNDGDLDLVINNTNQEAFVYRNNGDALNENHFIQIDLRGPGKNRFGIGAKVRVTTNAAEFMQTVSNSRGFQSSVSPILTIGIGPATEVKTVEITWPGGETQTVEGLPIDAKSTIEYNPSGSIIAPKKATGILNQASVDLDYIHQENTEFKDYNREYLIPRKYSTEGPAMAVGDVNGDGLDDLFLGGAGGQAAQLFIQSANGTLEARSQPNFEQMAPAEDVDALFFDADRDGDLDLYVVSGGNELAEGQLFLFDRLFRNDGKGNFRFDPAAIPRVGSNGSSVSAADIDGDGDTDLFVAGAVVPGNYGLSPKHYLLVNDGRGRFQDLTSQLLPASNSLGMLSDAKWFDYDEDGDLDLLTAGEWNPLRILSNDGTGRLEEVAISGFENTDGWWNSLELADLDGDGDLDIVAGNLGLNSKLKASKEKPASLYVSDFDKNGQTDPVLFHHMGTAEIPFATRDDLIKQMAVLKKKHANYAEYARIRSPEDILPLTGFDRSKIKHAYTFTSSVFINQGNGQFEVRELPKEAQLSPIRDFVIADVNEDKIPDLIGVGNFYGFRNDLGRAGAQPISVLIGDGTGEFTSKSEGLIQAELQGEYRKISHIRLGTEPLFVAVRNNQSVIFLKRK